MSLDQTHRIEYRMHLDRTHWMNLDRTHRKEHRMSLDQTHKTEHRMSGLNAQNKFGKNSQFMWFLTLVLFGQGEGQGRGDQARRGVQTAVSALASCCRPQSCNAAQ